MFLIEQHHKSHIILFSSVLIIDIIQLKQQKGENAGKKIYIPVY